MSNWLEPRKRQGRGTWGQRGGDIYEEPAQATPRKLEDLVCHKRTGRVHKIVGIHYGMYNLSDCEGTFSGDWLRTPTPEEIEKYRQEHSEAA